MGHARQIAKKWFYTEELKLLVSYSAYFGHAHKDVFYRQFPESFVFIGKLMI